MNTASAGSTPGASRQGTGKTQKIRRKRATVARYLAASRLRRPFASTSSPSPSLMERGLGGEARDKPTWTDGRVLPTSGGSYRHHTPNTRKSAAESRRGDPVRMAPVGAAAAQSVEAREGAQSATCGIIRGIWAQKINGIAANRKDHEQ